MIEGMVIGFLFAVLILSITSAIDVRNEQRAYKESYERATVESD